MANKAGKKKPAANGRTTEEQRLSDERRRLAKIVRDQKAVVVLMKRVMRGRDRTDKAVIDMAKTLLLNAGVLPFAGGSPT